MMEEETKPCNCMGESVTRLLGIASDQTRPSAVTLQNAKKLLSEVAESYLKIEITTITSVSYYIGVDRISSYDKKTEFQAVMCVLAEAIRFGIFDNKMEEG